MHCLRQSFFAPVWPVVAYLDLRVRGCLAEALHHGLPMGLKRLAVVGGLIMEVELIGGSAHVSVTVSIHAILSYARI